MRLHLGTKQLERTAESLKLQYINRFIQLTPRKETKTQNLEISGRLDFGKGLYHNQEYEDLMMAQKTLREDYVKSVDLSERKNIANQQHALWLNYISLRFNQLPPELHISPKEEENQNPAFYKTNNVFTNFKGNAYQVLQTFRDPKTNLIVPEALPEAYYEIATLFKFRASIDPDFINQMVHPSWGYLTKLKGGLTFNEVWWVWEILLVATFEKLLGQEMLSKEISSFAYWEVFRNFGMIDKRNSNDDDSSGIAGLQNGQKIGYMEFDEFTNLLEVVRFEGIESWEDFEQEFQFLIENSQEGEFLDTNEKVIRSDFFRSIFLERNL